MTFKVTHECTALSDTIGQCPPMGKSARAKASFVVLAHREVHHASIATVTPAAPRIRILDLEWQPQWI